MNAHLPLRVLIVDDHLLIREAMALLLSNRCRIQVVAQADSGREAIACFREHKPDVVLMDVRMPNMDGIEATAVLCRDFPDAKVIMLSGLDTEEDEFRAFSAGAKAYILKSGTVSELIQAIEAALVAVTSSSKKARQSAKIGPWGNLTPREIEILACIAKGMSNQEIGAHLFLAEGTVRTHVYTLLKKLQVNDRTSALIIGLKRGLVRLE